MNAQAPPGLQQFHARLFAQNLSDAPAPAPSGARRASDDWRMTGFPNRVKSSKRLFDSEYESRLPFRRAQICQFTEGSVV
jgi:hypothetical protein